MHNAAPKARPVTAAVIVLGGLLLLAGTGVLAEFLARAPAPVALETVTIAANTE